MLTLEQRFWSKVDKNGPIIREELGECWLWDAARLDNNYGVLWLNGRNVNAHRISYLISRGYIDDTLPVLHRCDNPPCIRPEHLFQGTYSDNMYDKELKGRGMRGRTHDGMITPIQALEIYSRYKSGERSADICKDYDISRQYVSDIVFGRTNKLKVNCGH